MTKDDLLFIINDDTISENDFLEQNSDLKTIFLELPNNFNVYEDIYFEKFMVFYQRKYYKETLQSGKIIYDLEKYKNKLKEINNTNITHYYYYNFPENLTIEEYGMFFNKLNNKLKMFSTNNHFSLIHYTSTPVKMDIVVNNGILLFNPEEYSINLINI